MRMRAEMLRIDGLREIHHAWGRAALFVLDGELAVAGDIAHRFDTVLLDEPRPLIVNANVPWVSSQARTQRLQTMHLLGS